jgi:hypothetical protein
MSQRKQNPARRGAGDIRKLPKKGTASWPESMQINKSRIESDLCIRTAQTGLLGPLS